MKTARRATIERITTESRITIGLTLDGTGKRQIGTTIPFLDHMLDLLAKHGLFDLTIKASGDTHIDDHHTVEDIGIVLGEAFKKALGPKEGIRRFGTAWVPLDETLAQVTVDLSGRPYLVYNVKLPHRRIKGFDLYLFEDFFQALTTHAAMNLHINVPYGRNPHHIMESIFKAMAKALDQAVSVDPRVKGVLSTKGSL
ncbi:MAG TPA: imidazoleglycerol-phosphate dehydratase HisB [Nitrospirales bacterium]|nr:imidazoleglycerol-phosphate dehydratase HisB [Nitrospirales bacterium]